MIISMRLLNFNLIIKVLVAPHFNSLSCTIYRGTKGGWNSIERLLEIITQTGTFRFLTNFIR